MKVDLWVVILVLFCALLGAMGQIFFKSASKDFSISLEGFFFNYKFLLGATLYAISAMLFVYSLKFGNLSILYPIIATSYIWVSLLAVLLLGEPFPVIKWLGVTLILAGITIIVR